MLGKTRKIISKTLKQIKSQGLWKEERIILSPQGPEIKVGKKIVLNFCANNYLGLCNHPQIKNAAIQGIKKYGYGMSSVRFICGTLDVHKQLEQEISSFLKTDDTILYSSCMDANAGLFETLLGEKDVVISDRLNHASIIDGIRLCKAERKIFQHGDMNDLEEILKTSRKYKTRLVVTDGVFSMDGEVAKLKDICRLAQKYKALVMVDDSHATGFVGRRGRGTPEYWGVERKVDIITSTLGKALGGASGGFTSGRKAIISLLRQRSRPYLFSNTIAPVIAQASIASIKMLKKSRKLIKKLKENTKYFRAKMTKLGFNIQKGWHPIIPIILGEARLANNMAKDLLKEGIYVIGFSYPVVPKGEARIRVQISAIHQKKHLDQAIQSFYKIGKKYKVI